MRGYRGQRVEATPDPKAPPPPGALKSVEAVEIDAPPGCAVVALHAALPGAAADVADVLESEGVVAGVAHNEASGDRLVRTAGTSTDLVAAAEKACLKLRAGNAVVAVVGVASVSPEVLRAVAAIPSVATIHAAKPAGSPLALVVASASPERRGVLGALDGLAPLGVEGA